jgi:hypothetical protein
MSDKTPDAVLFEISLHALADHHVANGYYVIRKASCVFAPYGNVGTGIVRDYWDTYISTNRASQFRFGSQTNAQTRGCIRFCVLRIRVACDIEKG